MLWWHILLIAVAAVIGALILFIALTFTLYWYNLDMKLINWFYNKMAKHYDNMKRDRNL